MLLIINNNILLNKFIVHPAGFEPARDNPSELKSDALRPLGHGCTINHKKKRWISGSNG